MSLFLRIFLLFAGLHLAAEASGADQQTLPRIVLKDDGIDLRLWEVLGPFEARSGEAAIDVDFLERKGGVGEAMFVPAELARHDHRRTDASSEHGSVDFSVLFKQTYPDGFPEMAVYAVCEIVAEHEQEAWLLLGSDDGIKVWLNGEQRFIFPEGRWLNAYDDVVRLPLRQGANTLLVKITNLSGDWAMIARLEPDIVHATKTVLTNIGGFLNRGIVPPDHSLELNTRIFPRSAHFAARIETSDGVPERSGSISPQTPLPLTGLDRGLYQLVVDAGSSSHSQTFYCGTMDELQAEMVTRSASVVSDDRIKINMDTLLFRIDFLNKSSRNDIGASPNIQAASARHSDYKTIYAAKALNDAIIHLSRGEEAFRHRTGLHLRAFRSRIDDQPLHYRLFVPSNYQGKGNGLPLVIVMPTVFERKRPYLESVYVEQQTEAETWTEIAEKLGIGLLWPGYRTCPYGNPTDFTHLDEVMGAVAADYLLDQERLYLYGLCSAGMTSSMEVARHPDKYAAIAFLNPVLHRLKGRYDDTGEFSEVPAYRKWLQDTDPVAALASIGGLPTWLIHDGIDSGHGPLSHAVGFVEQARALGNHPKFDRVRDSQESRKAVVQRQLTWLARQKRTNATMPKATIAHEQGPLNRALAERFVVVRGTIGMAQEHAASERWCREFQEAWLRTNFVPCRVIDDTQLAPGEETESNLVLIGNPQTNAVWKRLEAQLPVALANDEASINGHKWKGGDLSIQTWVFHPEHPDRKIVFIGAHDLSICSVGTMELALDGWFDFAVWRKEADKAVLLDAGYFDPAEESIVPPAVQKQDKNVRD